jgi:UDP-2,3-diacylglucosamine pyrophosphatase LpxH
MSNHGTRVIYITGNHDEALRKYSDFILGNFELVDKLILDLDGKTTWIFHGDVFDSSTKGYAKIVAKLGGKGYDLLILLNSFVNWILVSFGREKRSFSKAIKNSVKKAVSFVSNFETTAAEIAIEKKHGKVLYLNSGDWVENLTALEYKKEKWTIYQYNKTDYAQFESQEEKVVNDIVSKILS